MREVEYRLEPATGLHPSESGEVPRGYTLLWDMSGTDRMVGWDSVGPEHGLLVLPVAGVEHRGEEAQGDSFAAGQPVVLAPEPKNPHDSNAVAFASPDGKQKLGYVRRSDQERVTTLLGSGEPMRACVMWEWHKGSGRTGAAVLIARDGLVEGMPAGPVMQGEVKKKRGLFGKKRKG